MQIYCLNFHCHFGWYLSKVKKWSQERDRTVISSTEKPGNGLCRDSSSVPPHSFCICFPPKYEVTCDPGMFEGSSWIYTSIIHWHLSVCSWQVFCSSLLSCRDRLLQEKKIVGLYLLLSAFPWGKLRRIVWIISTKYSSLFLSVKEEEEFLGLHPSIL